MSNPTSDLSDDQYMEQIHLLAQAITTMPGATPEHANVTTPAPIRARWATYLIKLGVRIDPDLATHGLLRQAGMAAGNHAPRTLQPLKREDMWAIVKEQSPELYEKYLRGEAGVEDFRQGISEEIMGAVQLAMQEKARQQKEEGQK